MTWDYEEEYEKLLEKLDKDDRRWNSPTTLPNDGTLVFLKCGHDYKGDTLYDIGRYEDYTSRWWYDHSDPDSIEGEWNTEFGNMEAVTGWKIVELPEVELK